MFYWFSKEEFVLDFKYSDHLKNRLGAHRRLCGCNVGLTLLSPQICVVFCDFSEAVKLGGIFWYHLLTILTKVTENRVRWLSIFVLPGSLDQLSPNSLLTL